MCVCVRAHGLFMTHSVEEQELRRASMHFEHQPYSTTGYLGFVMRKWFAFSALMVLGQLSTVSWWPIVAQGDFCLLVYAEAQLPFWEISCGERKEKLKCKLNIVWLFSKIGANELLCSASVTAEGLCVNQGALPGLC